MPITYDKLHSYAPFVSPSSIQCVVDTLQDLRAAGALRPKATVGHPCNVEEVCGSMLNDLRETAWVLAAAAQRDLSTVV